MSLSDKVIECVQKPKQTALFNKLGSQSDRAAPGWALATHPGSFNATSESSTAPGCSALRMGTDSQECCATLRAFDFDLVLRQVLLQDMVMSVFGQI